MNNHYELYPIKTTFLRWSNYSYIVIDTITKAALIVDPAWDFNKIVDSLTQVNARLKAILLTHAHFDHTNLVKPLIKKFNTAVYMSKQEIDYYHFQSENLFEIQDKETIMLGSTEVCCLFTPGHTVGSMCYLLSNNIFTGDTLFSEGCGICDGDGGSAEMMFESVQNLKSQLSKHTRIYPGHSYGITPGHTMDEITKQNIYLHIKEKELFINFRMRKK